MKSQKYVRIYLLILFLSAFFLTNCNSPGFKKETTQNLSSAETVFEALLPEPVSDGDELFLEIIDDVTGIGLNPTRYQMQEKDDQSFFTRIPIIKDSVIKYRYILRSGSDLIERNSASSSVLYRLYFANKPSIVRDVIQSWSGEQTEGPKGEISGFIYDQQTDLPVSDTIIAIGGNLAVSSANGYFEFKDVPIGSYLLTAIHPEGLYEPFQQGAVIAENALTPASFGIKSADLVDIEFIVAVPENTINGAPMRLIGNTIQTGNVFTDLNGSASVIPSRAPEMTYDGDRTYRINLQLPTGMDFRYKFTLGNGLINAERSENGEFLTRQLIVPKKSAKVNNIVYSWSNNLSEIPIQFTVTVPEITPHEDILSIQFNPYAWTPPIPMREISQNKWTFSLYGPFEYLDKSQFRVCRNDQCGYADDMLTAGNNASGFILDFEELGIDRSIAYNVDAWIGQEPISGTTATEQYRYDKPGFISGMVLADGYNPYWLPHLEWGLINAAISGADYMVISPSWAFQESSFNEFQQKPGETFFSAEIQEYYTYAQQAGMDLIIYPTLGGNGQSAESLWENIDTSNNSWSNWFSTYARMIESYAYLSEQMELKYIIIGGPSAAPAFPDGRLPDGNPSNTPYDTSEQWSALIASIREIYKGLVIFALPDTTMTTLNAYKFLSNVDGIMVHVNSPLSETGDADLQQITSEAAKLLDSSISKIYQIYNKPVLLGLQYSAIDGSANDCAGFTKNCDNLLLDNETTPELLPVDLNEQAMIYQAFYSQILSRDWVMGIFSIGYNPSVIVRDASTSVHGKPALDVMAYYNNQIIQR